MEILLDPWPWYIAGPLIALNMFLLIYFGETFGVSSNLRTICAMSGAKKYSEFFDFNWRNQIWNVVFIVGAGIGGYVSSTYLSSDVGVHLSMASINSLKDIGIASSSAFLPEEIFSFDRLCSFSGFMTLLFGGVLVGFGARYAGGCTSGHAITGLSSMQLPSLIAVIGFFVGGLVMTHFLLPFIIQL